MSCPEKSTGTMFTPGVHPGKDKHASINTLTHLELWLNSSTDLAKSNICERGFAVSKVQNGTGGMKRHGGEAIPIPDIIIDRKQLLQEIHHNDIPVARFMH